MKRYILLIAAGTLFPAMLPAQAPKAATRPPVFIPVFDAKTFLVQARLTTLFPFGSWHDLHLRSDARFA
jgi:hypothetical protein